MNKQFIVSGSTVNIIDTNTTIHKELPLGIYQIKKTPTGSLYLDRLADKFDLGTSRKYDVTDGLSDKIKKFWKRTQKSLGVLFVGPKGCGKTFSAKQIATDLNLPVILVTEYDDNLQEFISNIAGRAVIILDEFEKMFDRNEEQTEMLTVLDGVYSASVDDIKMFIFTANDAYCLDENFLGRPGRIRYVKNFTNLSVDVVRQIVDDNLTRDTDSKDEIINFIREIRYITVDVVKAVIDEINMFGFNPEELNSTLNIQHKTYEYFVYKTAYYQNSEAFLEEYKKWDESGREGHYTFDRDVVMSDIKFESLKLGMKFDDEEIIYIKDNIITTIDTEGKTTTFVVDSQLNRRMLAF